MVTPSSSKFGPKKVRVSQMELKEIANPEAVRDDELRHISLKNLEKYLPSSTSSRSTMNLYIRWLEIQRRRPTSMTEQWRNTARHWAQSLQERGFAEREVVNELKKWLDDHGPPKVASKRQFPTAEEIAQAYKTKPKERIVIPLKETKKALRAPRNEDLNERAEERGGRKLSERELPTSTFEAKPPRNYICNRCGKSGHFFQHCPTNLDPDYDMPLGLTYFCKVCQQRGEHFESLCPHNTSPDSIIEERKRLNIETPMRDSIDSLTDHSKAEYKLDRRNEYRSSTSLISESWNMDPDSHRNNITPKKSKKVAMSEHFITLDSESGHSLVETTASMGRYEGHRAQKKNRRESGEFTGMDLPSQRNSPATDPSMTDMMNAMRDESMEVGEIFNSEERDRKRPRTGDLFPGHSGPLSSRIEQDSVTGSRKWQRKRARLNDLSEKSTFTEHTFWTEGLPSSHHLFNQGQKLNYEMDIDEPTVKGGGNRTKIPHREPEASPTRRSGMDSLQIDKITLSISDSETSDSMEVNTTAPATKPKPKYSEFVQNLIRRQPALLDVVNTIKPRPTALEMWNEKAPSSSSTLKKKQNAGDMMTEDTNDSMITKGKNDNKMQIPQYDGGDDQKHIDKYPGLNRRLSVINKFNVVDKFNVMDKFKKLTNELPQFKLNDHRLLPSFSGVERLGRQMIPHQNKPVEDQNKLQVNAASSVMKLIESKVARVESPIEGRRVRSVSNVSANSLTVKLQGICPSLRAAPDSYAHHYVSDAEPEEDPKMLRFKKKGDEAAYMVLLSLHLTRQAREHSIREMKKWASDFKVDYPMPEELLPLLSKDPIKQQKILSGSQNMEVLADDVSKGYYDGFSDTEEDEAIDMRANRSKVNRSTTVPFNMLNNNVQVNSGNPFEIVNYWTPTRADSVIGSRQRTLSFTPRATFADQLDEPKPDIFDDLKLFGATFKIPTSLSRSHRVHSRTLVLA